MRSPAVIALPFASFMAVALLAPRQAHADVTSWMAFGGGTAVQRNQSTQSFDLAPALTYSLGVGSSPLAPLVVGGILRGQTFVGFGTDLGLAVRVASGGFARGDWGIALDEGAVWRPWGNGAYGTWPLQTVLTLGAPWGLQLATGVEVSSLSGDPPAAGFFAALELDLLRFTVMRRGSTDRWWLNPSPAGGP